MSSLVCAPVELEATLLGIKYRPGEKREGGQGFGDCGSAVDVISEVLRSLCGGADSVELGEGDWLRDFTSDSEPSFGLKSFISFLVKRAGCPFSVLVVALIYLDRLKQDNPSTTLSMFTIHRLFLTALLLACKFLDDRGHGNLFFAQMVNCSIEEMNQLEMAMLAKLRFKLFVSDKTFATYASCLVSDLLPGSVVPMFI
mmetsp:Transcript_25021/g.98861  ORF Transcript_25021/g.98861 Transcript_25021/m.98861 type:complete len:199 (-) Transcript_25021:124-720(-)